MGVCVVCVGGACVCVLCVYAKCMIECVIVRVCACVCEVYDSRVCVSESKCIYLRMHVRVCIQTQTFMVKQTMTRSFKLCQIRVAKCTRNNCKSI